MGQEPDEDGAAGRAMAAAAADLATLPYDYEELGGTSWEEDAPPAAEPPPLKLQRPRVDPVDPPLPSAADAERILADVPARPSNPWAEPEPDSTRYPHEAPPLALGGRRPASAPESEWDGEPPAPAPPAAAPAAGVDFGADLDGADEEDDLPVAAPLPPAEAAAPPPPPPPETAAPRSAAADAGDADESADAAFAGALADESERPLLRPDDAALDFITAADSKPSVEPESAAQLTPEYLLRPERTLPESPLGRAVHLATGGRVSWESPSARRRRALTARAKTAIGRGHLRVAVISGKGGVGKTSLTMALGMEMAQLRGDRVIALDANPDQGTLASRVRTETAATVRDLLAHRDSLATYAAVRGFTSQSSSRLEVLASDPAAARVFSADDYAITAEILERFYSLLLTDTGTDLTNDALAGEGGVLDLCDQAVVVCGPALDEARVASATLDKLDRQGRGHIVERSVVAINARSKAEGDADLDALERHFRSKGADVVRIPYDPHLARGEVISLEALHRRTRDAVLALAAAVGGQFA